MSTVPVLDLSDIAHAYHRTIALRGVSLTVERAEIVAVTGPSGCGKSTLLHAAAGIIRPQRGVVHVLGQDLALLDETERTRLRRGRIGIVLQFGQLVPDVPVLDNVALPLMFNGEGRLLARKAAHEWLARVGVADERDAVPAELSGGETQRVALARALITDPALILADEPTGALDTIGGEALLELLIAHARDRSASVVLVTHDNVVASRADREIRLRDGVVESVNVLR